MSSAMNERPRLAPAGHLARLVERLAPIEPILRRRRPALFEDAAPPAADGPPDAADEPFAMPYGTPERHGGMPAPTTPRGPARQMDTPSARVYTPDARAAPTREPPPVDATIRDASMPLPGTTPPAPAAAVPLGAPPLRARPSPPPSMADAAEAARRPEGSAPAPGRDTPQRAERADAVPPSTLPRLAAAQAVALALPSRPAPRPAPTAPPRELPPIEVTIGRIEVRAANVAPPAPRHRGPAPRLGLDQYLRERGDSR